LDTLSLHDALPIFQSFGISFDGLIDFIGAYEVLT
jgi:hypothetical protein